MMRAYIRGLYIWDCKVYQYVEYSTKLRFSPFADAEVYAISKTKCCEVVTTPREPRRVYCCNKPTNRASGVSLQIYPSILYFMTN